MARPVSGGARRRAAIGRRLAASITALLILAAAPRPGGAATAEEADWPCQQRLVPEIAAGMIWRGPPVDAATAHVDDPAITRLATELAARRVPLAEASAQIDAFANALPTDQKNDRLTRLFAATLELINRDRGSIIGGIRKYARGQQALAERITASNERITQIEADQIQERDALMAERDWDMRIYDDRRSSLTYLCEQPVLLEQRAFAVARAIADHLVE